MRKLPFDPSHRRADRDKLSPVPEIDDPVRTATGDFAQQPANDDAELADALERQADLVRDAEGRLHWECLRLKARLNTHDKG